MEPGYGIPYNATHVVGRLVTMSRKISLTVFVRPRPLPNTPRWTPVCPSQQWWTNTGAFWTLLLSVIIGSQLHLLLNYSSISSIITWDWDAIMMTITTFKGAVLVHHCLKGQTGFTRGVLEVDAGRTKTVWNLPGHRHQTSKRALHCMVMRIQVPL